AWRVVRRTNVAAKGRLDAEHRKEVSRYPTGVQRDWPARVQHHDLTRALKVHAGYGLERMSRLPKRREVLVIDRPMIATAGTSVEPDGDQVVLIPHWKPAQQHAVQHTEHRGAGADTQGEGRDGDERESGIPAERARSIVGVPADVP